MGKNPELKKYHYVYRIEFETGEWYVGVHSTDDMDDDYFASGSDVRDRRGEPHDRSIVSRHRTRAAAFAREEKEIGDSYRTDPLCLNNRPGGHSGGRFSDRTLERMSRAQKKRYEEDPQARVKNSEAVKKFNRENPGFAAENGKRISAAYDEDPGRREKARRTKIEYFSDPANCEKQRAALLKANDPDTESGRALRRKNGKAQKKRFEDPNEIEKSRAAKKAWFAVPENHARHCASVRRRVKENPESFKRQGETLKRTYEERPELRENARQKTREQFADPDKAARHREGRLRYFRNDPEAGARHGELCGHPVMVNGNRYRSANHASQQEGVSRPTIRRRIKAGVEGYARLVKEKGAPLAKLKIARKGDSP